jgi:hypothetical protein
VKRKQVYELLFHKGLGRPEEREGGRRLQRDGERIERKTVRRKRMTGDAEK